MFRREAIERRNIKWRGSAILLRGTPPWLIAIASTFFLLVFLTFVTVGTYTRRVNVSGEITTWPRAVNIYSGVQGFVVERFVTEGQLIKKGAPIYQIDVSKNTHTGVVDDNQRKEIKNQLIRVSNIIANLEENKKTTLQTLEKQQEQYRHALNRSAEILRRAEEGLHIMKKNMDNYRHYYQSKGLINKDQLISQVALYYQHQNSLLGLSAQHEQNRLQIISLESQIQTQAAEFDNRIHEMALKGHELQKELINTDVSDEIIVRALSEGKIDSLSVTVGQMVNPGDSLLQIMPGKVNYYYLVTWVPNDAMPYIAVGDKVNVRYEAFPAEKFGQFSANVTLISKTPASSQEMLTYPGAPKNTQGTSIPYYKIIVKPEKTIITYDGKKLPLENGMKAEVTLFLENRKIYQWMFSPFYDMKHSATGAVNAD